MKKIVAVTMLCLLLFGCSFGTSVETDDPAMGGTTVAGDVKPVTTDGTENTAGDRSAPLPMELVGVWVFSHSGIEGDTNTTGISTVVISGDSPEALTITYQDPSFPEENFSGKALKQDARELYPGCGNDAWVMDVDHVGAVGNTTYDLTLLEDGTLVLRFNFTVDGMPMVSYQFFTRGE